MLRILRSITTAARLYLLRRRQFDSAALRQFFKREYDIDVGLYSYGCFDRWRMPGPMRVGRYCSISSTVRSALRNHPVEALTTHPALYEKTFGVVDSDLASGEPLIIEDDVWIGHNVVILSGCKLIGRGAVVGAGSVVTRDVAAYTIVAGSPAKRLRERFEPALAAAIDASEWWKLDLVELGELVREDPEIVFNPSIVSLSRLRSSLHDGAAKTPKGE